MYPNHNQNVFKRIFLEHWAEYNGKSQEPQIGYYGGVVKKMLGCADPANGYKSYRCLWCGEVKKVPFSCKSSFCLTCAKLYTDQWVEYISRTLFPGVRYRHIVLTVPEFLRKYFYQKDDDILDAFMKTGHIFYQDAASTWLKAEVEVGSGVVLQTAGRSSNFNPHLHILGTSGGKTKDGQWKEFGYIDFNLFHIKWQYHLLKMVRENVKLASIAEDIDKCWRDYPKGLVAYIEKGDVPSGGKGLARYIAKYVVSPPIAMGRIIKYDGNNVRYWYNDHTTNAKVEEEVDALTFIGRMVQHILPKGFQRIRYYGLHGTCKASKVREELKELLGDAPEPETGTYRVTGYRERIKNSFGKDPLSCPRCGHEMEYEGIWHPDYGWLDDNWDDLFREEIRVTDYG